MENKLQKINKENNKLANYESLQIELSKILENQRISKKKQDQILETTQRGFIGLALRFERRPEICKYNPYISNYLAKPRQIENFDASNSSSITYQDLIGNVHTNIGPVFGNSKSTSEPIINDVDSEL